MKPNDAKVRDSLPPGFGASEDDSDSWISPELLRLIVAPIIATILFLGGIYWIKAQHVDAPTNRAVETTSFVQVHLLPRPDPIPVPTTPLSSSKVGTVGGVRSNIDQAAQNFSNQTETTADDQIASTEPDEAIAAPSISLRTRDSAAQSAAIAKFTEALLRHISHYQRYPKAAEPLHLQGTVATVFSISRTGRLLGVWVKASSGAEVLDEAAIETIRRAQPLPAIPAELPDPLKIEVKLGFDR